MEVEGFAKKNKRNTIHSLTLGGKKKGYFVYKKYREGKSYLFRLKQLTPALTHL